MKRLIGSVCSIPVVVGVALSLVPTLSTSEKGLTHIAKQEGCVRCTYSDKAGYTTVGVGHRSASEGRVKLTDEEVGALYALDVKKAESCVFEHLDGRYMPQSVFDASVSLVFNVGCQGVLVNPKTGRPTHYSRTARAHDWNRTCYYLGDFVYAAGVPMLRDRRAADQALCIEDIPYAGSDTSLPP